MKPRKVVVTLDLFTDAPIQALKDAGWSHTIPTGYLDRMRIHRVDDIRVNVVGKSDHEKHVALARKFRETLGG